MAKNRRLAAIIAIDVVGYSLLMAAARTVNRGFVIFGRALVFLRGLQMLVWDRRLISKLFPRGGQNTNAAPKYAASREFLHRPPRFFFGEFVSCHRNSSNSFALKRCVFYLKKISISLFFVAACLDGAQSASLQDMSDGAVVFKTLGERMLLRLSDFRDRLQFKDYSHKNFTVQYCIESLFPNLSERESLRHLLEPNATGRGVLEKRPISKCMWDQIRTDKPDAADKQRYVYTFFVDFTIENDAVFPGEIPVDEMPKDGFAPHGIPRAISFDLIARNSQAEWVTGFTFETDGPSPDPGINALEPFPRDQWPPHPCQPQPEVGEITAGFENRGRVTLEDPLLLDQSAQPVRSGKHIWQDSVQYYLPSRNRLGKTTEPLCVICGRRINPTPSCAEYLWSSDKGVRLQMRWAPGSRDDPSKMPTPSEDWIKADYAARKIAHSIFIDRPEGDFQ